MEFRHITMSFKHPTEFPTRSRHFHHRGSRSTQYRDQPIFIDADFEEFERANATPTSRNFFYGFYPSRSRDPYPCRTTFSEIDFAELEEAHCAASPALRRNQKKTRSSRRSASDTYAKVSHSRPIFPDVQQHYSEPRNSRDKKVSKNIYHQREDNFHDASEFFPYRDHDYSCSSSNYFSFLRRKLGSYGGSLTPEYLKQLRQDIEREQIFEKHLEAEFLSRTPGLSIAQARSLAFDKVLSIRDYVSKNPTVQLSTAFIQGIFKNLTLDPTFLPTTENIPTSGANVALSISEASVQSDFQRIPLGLNFSPSDSCLALSHIPSELFPIQLDELGEQAGESEVAAFAGICMESGEVPAVSASAVSEPISMLDTRVDVSSLGHLLPLHAVSAPSLSSSSAIDLDIPESAPIHEVLSSELVEPDAIPILLNKETEETCFS